MVIYSEKVIKFQRMPGQATKDISLTLLEEISRALIECLDLFHRQLGMYSQAIDQIMSMFVIIQNYLTQKS